MTAYRPTADLYTSGGPFVTLTASDGTSTVGLIIEQREAYALAAAIEETADKAVGGHEYAVAVAITA